MLFLILSIICSVLVGVLLKIARRFEGNSIQIVTFNYAFALMLCYFVFSPNFDLLTVDAPWTIYIPLGILLPTIFLVLAAAIKQAGIVKTDAAQRLSLFIPILAAWLLFKEDFSAFKIAALCIGFPALICILSKPESVKQANWQYPALVLIGYGVIDILFKQIAIQTNLPYTTSLFVVFALAFGIMIGVCLYDLFNKKSLFHFKNVILGGLIGLLNFGNILFYLKAHQIFADNPSTVFAGMNLGVIVLGSLVGIIFFKEKLSKINYLGLILALVAIVFIVLSQQS